MHKRVLNGFLVRTLSHRRVFRELDRDLDDGHLLEVASGEGKANVDCKTS